MNGVLNELVELSRFLGLPDNDFVILGEGNTSARADGESFWVKASGTSLATASPEGFVRVWMGPLLSALERERMTDEEIRGLLKSATIEGVRVPSIEAFLHALCLAVEGVRFVGHTHPSVALGLLSSVRSRELFQGSVFPDQIVVLGRTCVYIPYEDPGLPLARSVGEGLDDFLQKEGRPPKLILMENHGVIALGQSSREVVNVTQMAVKTCRVLAAALAAGGPRFLTDAHAARIDQRPDELARRREIQGTKQG